MNSVEEFRGEQRVVWNVEQIEIDPLDAADASSKFLAALNQDEVSLSTVPATIVGTANTRHDPDDLEREFAAREFGRLLRKEASYSDSPNFHSRLASFARLAGLAELAVDHAKTAAALDSSDERVFELAEVYLTFGHTQAARHIYAQLSEKGHEKAILRLAEFAIQDSDLDLARDQVSTGLKVDSLRWRTNMLAGSISLASGSFDHSIRFYRNALAHRPKSSVLHFNLSLAHLWSGNRAAALKSARIAASLSPLSRKLVIYFSDLALDRKHERSQRQAVSFLSRYMRLFDDDDVISRYTDLARNLGQQGLAAKTLLEVLPRFGTASVLNNIGVLNADLRDYQRASDWFRRGLAASEQQSAVHQSLQTVVIANLLNSLVDSQKFEEAVLLSDSFSGANWELADSQFLRLLVARCKALLYLEREGPARDIYDRVYGHSILTPRVRFDLETAWLCYHATVTGDVKEALVHSARALDALKSLREPDSSLAALGFNNHAFVLLEAYDVANAASYLSRISDGQRGSYLFDATRGLLALYKGDLERGERLYRKASNAAPSRDAKQAVLKKMYFELAKSTFKNNTRLAQRYLRSAEKQKQSRLGWRTRYLDKRIKHLASDIENQMRLPPS